MIPWKRQQIWFWLAAIFLVVGASALRDTRHQTVDSNQVSKTSRSSTAVIRKRSDLPPLIEEKLLTESIPPIQHVAFEEPVELENRSDRKELIVDQDEIVRADFSELQVDHKESSTQVVQIAFEPSEPDQADHPAVWLSGTIEAVEDAPRIFSR